MEISNDIVRTAVKKVGTQGAFASLMGVSRQAVQRWCRNGYVPASKVAEFSRLTGVAPRYLNQAFSKVEQIKRIR